MVLGDAEREVVTMLREEIKRIMWKHAGIVRYKDGMENAQARLLDMKKKVTEMKVASETVELLNMVTTSLLIVRAAIRRKRNMGCHYRVDGK